MILILQSRVEDVYLGCPTQVLIPLLIICSIQKRYRCSYQVKTTSELLCRVYLSGPSLELSFGKERVDFAGQLTPKIVFQAQPEWFYPFQFPWLSCNNLAMHDMHLLWWRYRSLPSIPLPARTNIHITYRTQTWTSLRSWQTQLVKLLVFYSSNTVHIRLHFTFQYWFLKLECPLLLFQRQWIFISPTV